MSMGRVVLSFIALALGGGGAFALSEPEMVRILEDLDVRQRALGDFAAHAFIQRKEKGKEDVLYESLFYRRGVDDKFMFLVLSPKTEAGQGYLRIDDNLWLYSPRTGKWERLTERDRILGTDGRRQDFDESRPRKGRLGTEEVLKCEGADLSQYDPKNYYSEEQIAAYVQDLVEGRRAFTEEIAAQGLRKEIRDLAHRELDAIEGRIQISGITSHVSVDQLDRFSRKEAQVGSLANQCTDLVLAAKRKQVDQVGTQETVCAGYQNALCVAFHIISCGNQKPFLLSTCW